MKDYYAEPWRNHEVVLEAMQGAGLPVPEADAQVASILGMNVNYAYIFSNWSGRALDAYVYNPCWGVPGTWRHYSMKSQGNPVEWNASTRIHYVGEKAGVKYL